MKLYKYYLATLLSVLLCLSCSDDNESQGNPTIDFKTEFGSAMFGDKLPFKVDVADDVPLSTLKARIYFGEEMVSETVIRTKTEGEYAGDVYIPYYKNIPNGVVKLQFVLQNIRFTTVEKTYDLQVTRPEYPYLTFVTADKEYKMTHKDGYNYEVTETFPQKIKGYIKAPIITDNGTEQTFGWENNEIKEGSTELITFSEFSAGEYSITFNTFDYTAAPFIVAYTINEQVMEKVDDNNFKLDLDLTQGQEITIGGISDFNEWWIDQDFFNKEGDKLTFKPIAGKYRLSIDLTLNYLKAEVMTGDNLASLNSDGTGAIWLIGDSQGKPSYANSGWDPMKATCMVPMGNGKYKITFVAGKTILPDKVNFVFFHLKGWDKSFGPETLTVNSDLIIIGQGQDVNGVDKGNIALKEDKKLTEDKAYTFVIDVSKGIDKAVLTVEE